ncbi:MAG TPA: S46 family peptidase, partial [Elusimicrobiales bacterium]|nr:S46 family peptidase [Elusimicrobiales bacterium]
WSEKGAQKDDLIFIVGNPGTTSRLNTVAQLNYERDYYISDLLDALKFFRAKFYEYTERGPEQKRQIWIKILNIENYVKRYTGRYDALANKKIMAKIARDESFLKAKAKENKELKKVVGKSWEKLAKVQEKKIKRHKELAYREVYSRIGILGNSSLSNMANTIVRYAREMEKPNEKRFEEFRDSNLESVKFKLFSPAPIYPEMEEYILSSAFGYVAEKLGRNDDYTKALLGGQSPTSLADKLVSGTKLKDIEFRKKLIAGGKKAVDKCKDPMIVWARNIADLYSQSRQWYEDTVQGVEAAEGNNIAKVRFAVYGNNIYPDATGTLRLSYGKPAGYELGTTLVAYKTSFFGMFARAAEFDNEMPFTLPEKIANRKAYINMNTPLNIVSMHDTFGGNSGSPLFNKNLEYVGLLFDRNIQGLDRNYIYTETRGRTVSVHSAGITETLKNIYQADGLLEELMSR